MRRRVKPVEGTDLDVLAPALVPVFVDDLSLPVKQRVEIYDAWVTEHIAPWQAARDAYEKAHGVVIIDAAQRDLYASSRGVVFVENIPLVPSAPFDADDL